MQRAINGMQMYYEVRGDGEPLLLLHGFTGAGADWGLIFDEPPPGYRLIVPDLRGHGGSTNPSDQFTHRQSAQDVLALLGHLQIDTCKAIGLSAGGNTLLHMATQQPGRVDAMVLVSATSHFPAQARAVMDQFTVDRLSDDEWRILRQRHRHGDEQIRALWRQGQGFKDSHDDMNFAPPLLSTITARTLIVYGDRDPLYPASIALALYTAIPRSALWIIPNAGHAPIFGAIFPRFVETAMAFLREEETRES